MPKIIFTLTILIGFCSTSWSQDVELLINIRNDTLKIGNSYKFDTYSKAETYLEHKIDSLKQIGFPFLNSKVNHEDKTLYAQLILNQKIDSIHIYVDKKDSHWLPSRLKTKSNVLSIEYYRINSLLTSVVSKLQEAGATFGKVNLKDIELLANNKLKAHLNIEPGISRTIDGINVKGYSKLSTTYIKRYSDLKIGDQFIESQIQKKTDQLNAIPFLKVKKPTEVLFTRDSTELFVYLEKIQSNSFDGFLGFGNTENEGLKLNGYLNVVLLNNLNNGERLNIIYKNDGNSQQTFEADAYLPFILKTPMSIEARLRLFRRDSAF